MIRGDLSFNELGLTSNAIGDEGFRSLIEGIVQANIQLQKLWLFGSIWVMGAEE